MTQIPLPPMDPNSDNQLHLFKNGKYISFAVIDRTTPLVRTAFTLHQAEARKAIKLLTNLLASDENGSTFVEGAVMGGPPLPDDLMENR